MKRKRIVFGFVILLIAVAGNTFAQFSNISTDVITEGFMAAFNVPAMSLAVGDSRSIQYQKGYGNFNAYEQPYLQTQANTKFRIASVSKPLTSIVLFSIIDKIAQNNPAPNMTLEDKIKLILDRQVFGPPEIINNRNPNPVLPSKMYWRNTHPNFNSWDRIRIKHLLDHTSGFGWLTSDPIYNPNFNYTFDPRDYVVNNGGITSAYIMSIPFTIAYNHAIDKDLPISKDEILDFALQYSSSIIPPGTSYDYGTSGPAYLTLEYVISALYKELYGVDKTYEEIATELFESIGAFNTIPGQTLLVNRHKQCTFVDCRFDEARYYDWANPFTRSNLDSMVEPKLGNGTYVQRPAQYGGFGSLENGLASGGWLSTATDLINIMTTVINTSTVMSSTASTIMIKGSNFEGYGWGRSINQNTGDLINAAHGGAWIATKSLMTYDFQKYLSWANISNASGKNLFDDFGNYHNGLVYLSYSGQQKIGNVDTTGYDELMNKYNKVFNPGTGTMDFLARVSMRAPMFTVYGKSFVAFNDRAEILPNLLNGFRGNIGVGDTADLLNGNMIDYIANIGYQAKVQNVISMGDIILRAAEVQGHAVARKQVIVDDQARHLVRGDIIDGYGYNSGYMSIETNGTLYPVHMGSSLEISPQNDGSSWFLFPGSYGDVKINSNARVLLMGGTYYFKNLQIEPDAILHLANSRKFDPTNKVIDYKPIVIFVKEKLSIGSRVQMKLEKDKNTPNDPNTTTMASDILIVCASSRTVNVELNVDWHGTLLVPNGTIDFKGGSMYVAEGAFWGDRVIIHQGTKIKHNPFTATQF